MGVIDGGAANGASRSLSRFAGIPLEARVVVLSLLAASISASSQIRCSPIRARCFSKSLSRLSYITCGYAC